MIQRWFTFIGGVDGKKEGSNSSEKNEHFTC